MGAINSKLKTMIPISILILLSFLGTVLLLQINDILKNHLPIIKNYTYVLEKVELLNGNRQVLYSASVGKNKLAELVDFRRHKIGLGHYKLDVQFRDRFNGIDLYVNNYQKNFSSLIDFYHISAKLDGVLLDNLKKDFGKDNSIRLSTIGLSDKTNIKNNKSLELYLSLKDGNIIKLIFEYGENKILLYKGYNHYKDSSFGEKFILWWYGISFDKGLIESNLDI